MLRNILGATILFTLIIGVAVWVANLPDKSVVPPATTPVSTPPVAILLEPVGNFIPRSIAPKLTVRAVNLKSVYVRYYRVHDDALMVRLYRGITQGSLSPIAVARLLAETGPPLIALRHPLKNGTQDFTWPGTDAAETLTPGFYLVTAAANASSDAQAATWFIRSDLHVMALNDADGWHALCQNLRAHTTDVTLTWFGFDAAPILAADHCDVPGKIPAAVKIPTDAALQLLFGVDTAGNLAFVPLRGAQKITTDPAAGGTLTTERTHYLPGQTIMALAYGAAFTGGKISFALIQPNGLRDQEKPAPTSTAQLNWIDFTLPATAMPGIWQLAALKDGTVVRQIPVPVGDEPPGWRTSLRLLDRRDQNVSLAAKISDAHDVPLHNRAATLRTIWVGARQVPEISSEYAFGGYDRPEQQPQIAASWISGGNATLKLQLPSPPPASYPVQAQLQLEPWPPVRIVDMQAAHIVFPTHPWALGIRANFGDAPVAEGNKAEFKIALFKTAPTTIAVPSLDYELVTEHRSFRWFFADGKWDYKADVAAVTVERGTVDLDGSHKGQVAVTVPNGQYRLDVMTTDRALISSWRFQVGTPKPEADTLADLPLHIGATTDGRPQITTHAHGAITMIAADTRLRDVQTDTAAAPHDVAFVRVPSAQGENILIVATDLDADGPDARAHGEVWLPPQAQSDGWGTITLRIPDALVAGNTVKIVAQFNALKHKSAYGQIVAMPGTNRDTTKLLTAARNAPQPRRFAFASNIFPSWPAASTTTPTETSAAIPTGSSRSAIVPVGPDGQVEITLPLPDHAGPVTLHLLVWTADDIHEQTQNITLTAPPHPTTPAPTPHSSPTLALTGWACQEPSAANHQFTLTQPRGVSTKHQASPGPTFAILTPVALPDLPEALAALLQTPSPRTETMARTLIALQDFTAPLAAHGMTSDILRPYRTTLWDQILQRQQGDGGIAAFPDSTASDLNATALALQAWHLAAPDHTEDARLIAMKTFLQRRLDNPWNAENELSGRADGFYALSLFGQADAAALRYFVEKFGNQVRDAVREAELAAALRQIQDHEKSQAFSARSLAQLPSLRHDDVGRVWQVLALMAQHDMAPAEELATHAHALPPTPATTPWLAAVSLHARVAIARALPAWQADVTGSPPWQERGMRSSATFDKPGMLIQPKQGPTLYLCADHMPPHQTRNSTKITATVTRIFYSLTGEKIAATALRRGTRYILIIGGKNWRAGPGEIDVPLPSGLGFRTAVPGATVVGALNWINQSDPVAAAAPYDRGAMIAIERAHDGDGKVALLVETTEKTNAPWPATTLTQSQGSASSSSGSIKIR